MFGAVDATGTGRPMTVAFEFLLPTVDPRTGAPMSRADWAARFHALNSVPFGPGYNLALQAITDLFTRRGTSPARVGGSSLGQVRTNEILMGGAWQLREFHLTGSPDGPGLRLAPTAQTPVGSAVTDGTAEEQTLLRYSERIAHGDPWRLCLRAGGHLGRPIHGELQLDLQRPRQQSHPPRFCRTDLQRLPLLGNHRTAAGWFLSPVADRRPSGRRQRALLSNFIKLIEIPRRTFFMQNLLTCRGPTCAPGAEPELL